MTMPKALGLTSSTTRAAGRFFFGNVFAEGELPTGFYPHLDTPVYSSYIVNRWPDGSVRLATFTGTASFTANVEKQVNIVSRNYAPAASTGTALTTASIAASGATATVQFGTLGTVSLAGATLVQVHYADAQMICTEYRAKLGTTGLSAQFFVWLFADGLWYQRVTPWNGFFLDGSAQRDYVPTVTIDGTIVYNNGGVAYKHSPNTWYTFTRWSNGAATIKPRHDTAKLIDTGMVPNYTFDTPQAANSTYLAAIGTYTPGSNGGYTPSMPDTGAHDDIGVLPMWEAMYFVQRGEAVAYDAVIANGQAIGAYSVFHCDPTTLRPIKISSYPTHTQEGAGGGGNPLYGSVAQASGTYTFEIAHHPSCGYLAALLTGDPFYMQISQYVANACYLAVTGLAGSGINRILNGQDRQVGWSIRSISQAAALCPTSQAAYYDHTAWYGAQAVAYSNFADSIPGVGGFKVGMMNTYANYGNVGSATGVSFWQHDFIIASLGQSLLMKVGDSTARAKALNFFNYLANSIPWRTDTTYFTYGPQAYHLIPRSGTQDPDVGLLAANANPASAADIWAVNLDSAQIATLGDNTLHGGGSTGTGPGSYMDQLYTSVSYCATFNTPGSLAGRARIMGASNYASSIGSTSRATTPVFAISPMSVTHTPTFTAVDSGSGATVTTTGPSIRVDSLPLHTAGFFVTKQPGIGIPLSQIVAGGSDGTSPIYDAIQVAGGTVSSLSEIRLVAAAGTHGTYSPDETGGGIYSGDGASDTVNVDYYLDGAQINSAPMYFGTAPTSTVSGVVVSPSTATGSTTFTAVVNGTGSPSQAVTWARSGTAGSINASTGVFTAPSPTGSVQTITITATSTQDNSKSGTATVTIAAAVGSTVTTVTVSPASIGVIVGASQQFAATVAGTLSPSQAVTWTVSGLASISTGGLATGPIGVYTVTARSVQDNTKAGTALFAVLAPGSASLPPDIGLNTLIVQGPVGIAPFIG